MVVVLQKKQEWKKKEKHFVATDGPVLKTWSAHSLSISSACSKVCECPKLKALRQKNSHNADSNIWPRYLSALRFGIFRRLAYVRSSHNAFARPSPELRRGADFPIFTPSFQTKWFLAVTAMIKHGGKNAEGKKAVIPTSTLNRHRYCSRKPFAMFSACILPWWRLKCGSRFNAKACLFSNPMWYSCFTCLCCIYGASQCRLLTQSHCKLQTC